MDSQSTPPEQLISELINLYQSNQLQQMLAEIEDALTEYPDSGELFNLQGSSYYKAQEFGKAAESFNRALHAQPQNKEIVLNLAKALVSNDDFESAKQCLEEFLQTSPGSAEVYFQLGIVEQQIDELDNGIKSFETSIRLRPDFAGAHYNLGLIWARKENWPKAIEYYERAVALNAGSARMFNNLGVALQRTGNFVRSAEALQSAISLQDNYSDAYENLGDTLRLSGQTKKAKDTYQQAANIDPNNSRAHACIGFCLQKTGSYEEAARSFRTALSIEPKNASYRFSLGLIHATLGEFDLALEELEACTNLQPGFIEAHKNKCEILEKLNRIDQLESALQAVLEALSTNDRNGIESFGNDFGYFQAKVCFRQKKYQEALDQIEAVSLAESEDDEVIRALKLKADCHNALGHYQQAFENYAKMNQCVRSNTAFDWSSSDYYLSRVEAHRKALSAISSTPYSRQPVSGSEFPSPVFLMGFPRSGTTLLDTILRTHSEIAVVEEKPTIARTLESVRKEVGIAELETLGELETQELRTQYFKELSRHTNFQDQTCTVDKMPLNSIHAPLIAQLFPEARIIFVVRHPMDCILSCYMQSFKLNAAMGNMTDLDRIVSLYCNVMQLWENSNQRYRFNVLFVRYEDLILDFQKEVSEILDFLNLEWEQSLTDYRTTAEKRGRISTPSYSQVVQPIYQSASYRWKNYRAQLDRFMDDVQPWIEKFKYEI